jgi:predicted amidohydrolase
VKLAAVQLAVRVCYDRTAIQHLRERVRECERLGVTLLCCPEGAIGGLADYVDLPDAIAVPSSDRSLETLLEPLASDVVTVIVGFTERAPGGCYHNAAAIYAHGTVLGIYRKRHPAIRHSCYTAGTETSTFAIAGGTVGILICRDSIHANLAATLVQQGAQVLCVPTNNGMPPDRGGVRLIDDVRTLDMQYATTLGVPVVRADVFGQYGGLTSPGASMVTLPTGLQVRAGGAPEGELLVVESS